MSYYPSYQEQLGALSPTEKDIATKLPNLEDIDGWLLLSEAVELFSLATHITSSIPIICEIGVWKGKSSYVFASALRKMGGTLYSIDPFNGDGDSVSRDDYRKEISNMPVTLLQNFEQTINKYDLSGIVKVLPMLSEDARGKFPESKIDLLFIDGNHDYDAVKKDYELWSPLIPSKGTIVLHDVLAKHTDGPRRVMEDFIKQNPVWENVRIVGEMCVATKV